MIGADGYPTDCGTGDPLSFVSVSAAATRHDAICALAHNADAGVLFGVVVGCTLVFLGVVLVVSKWMR